MLRCLNSVTFPKEVVEYPSPEIFKIYLDTILGTMFQGMLLEQGGWKGPLDII